MSAVMAEGCFLSALQPNSSCTAYVLPSDGPSPDPVAKARRVREQVRMRLAEKKSLSLPKLDDSLIGSAEYSFPEAKGFTHTHGFSSRSMIHTPSRVMAVSTAPLHSSGFSSRSAVETGSKVSHKGTSIVQSNFHASQSHSRNHRSKSLCQADQEGVSLTVLGHQDNAPYRITEPALGTLRRSLSGILAQDRGYSQEEELPYQYTYKGPSHRTISRITNRQQQYQQQSSGFGQEGWYQAPLHRAASVHSVRSVGKGVDIVEGGSIHSNDPLGEIQSLDMTTAVRYLAEADPAMQVLGAAYIQHQCYHSNDAKNQVRALRGIPALVQLFSSDNQEVLRFATGAMRNLIYENVENKVTLIDAGGVQHLINILKEPDEELRKTITGILWNLSSRDNLKEKLSKEALSELTEKVLIPLCNSIPLSPSEKDIFYNTTGCLRNLSSVNERTRQKMREMRGLVDSLVSYIQHEDSANDKGLENSLCVLRNLSYQLYTELPSSVRLRLEGSTRASASRDSDAIGCFSLYNKKNAEQRNQYLSVLNEVSKLPKGAEWLWHPKILSLYKLVLQNSYISSTSREAAIGALQNITAGEARWSAVLSNVAVEQERMLPILLDLLDTNNDMELRPLTGLLRNLAKHSTNKNNLAKNMVNILVSKLPSDGLQKTLSSEVVINICGALNHLVTCSSSAARDILYLNGVPKLQGIKTSHDNSPGGLKAATAASTVLCNMFQYNKLHRDYRLRGLAKRDFIDATI
ncbi:hypothetical protein Q5P01_006093 [Channa striata]|uniref:Plakophilin 3 n=1 Tax=Channa striata TaxID=64152 RepID=A0AA88N7D1_CHASR|nr:hypothetical protein Q5P01_006093 [Channa striata]